MFCWSRLSRENRMRESCLCFKPPWRCILFFLWHSPCWGMEQNFLLPNLRSGLILFCTNRLQRALFLHPVRDYRQGTGTVEGRWNCVLRLKMWILIVKCVGKSWIAEGGKGLKSGAGSWLLFLLPKVGSLTPAVCLTLLWWKCAFAKTHNSYWISVSFSIPYWPLSSFEICGRELIFGREVWFR